VSVKYIVPNSGFLSWYMAYPIKRLLFTIHYPRELELYKFIYGLNRSVVEENNDLAYTRYDLVHSCFSTMA